jgi:hypothetical protein
MRLATRNRLRTDHGGRATATADHRITIAATTRRPFAGRATAFSCSDIGRAVLS